jgi:hypothetical protein
MKLSMKIETLFSPIALSVITMISPNFGISALAILGSLTFILLNLSKIKFEIVDKEFGGSWLAYFKNLFNINKK